jgi:hypothetical protein
MPTHFPSAGRIVNPLGAEKGVSRAKRGLSAGGRLAAVARTSNGQLENAVRRLSRVRVCRPNGRLAGGSLVCWWAAQPFPSHASTPSLIGKTPEETSSGRTASDRIPLHQARKGANQINAPRQNILIKPNRNSPPSPAPRIHSSSSLPLATLLSIACTMDRSEKTGPWPSQRA